MNLPTTKEELEVLFRDHWGEKDTTSMRDLKPLFQLAKESEAIRGVAAGGLQMQMTGVSLGGINFAPTLVLILMGFRLGCIWSGGKSVDPSDPIVEPTAMDAFLKYIAENPAPKEEGKSE